MQIPKNDSNLASRSLSSQTLWLEWELLVNLAIKITLNYYASLKHGSLVPIRAKHP